MSNQTEPRLQKWPFFLGDVVLLGLAYFLYAQHTKGPFTLLEDGLFVVCGTLGALLAVAPFVMEYQAAVRRIDSGNLVSAVAEIRNLELIAVQISAATARWQVVQEHSANSVTAAKEIAERLAVEATAFTEFLTKTNDTDRANLRLEVEKLRRMENDWLAIIVRMLDHTYALFKAAERSGQPGLIEQLGHFQDSVRDVARRIGLLPYAPAANEPFDPEWHQLSNPEAVPPPGTRIIDTLATGYTYQGRRIRLALVSIPGEASAVSAIADKAEMRAAKETEVEPTLL